MRDLTTKSSASLESSSKQLVCGTTKDGCYWNLLLTTTDASVKSLAENYNAPAYTETAAEGQPAAEIVSDPTIANEAATEIAAGDGILANGHGHVEPEPASNGLANANVADEAANAVAESHWDTSNHDISLSQEWVDVGAIPAETTEPEPEANAEVATPDAKKQSWADDHPDPVAEVRVWHHSDSSCLFKRI